MSETVNEPGKTDKPDDPAEKIKSKIFTVVNKVVDRASREWEKQPEEKKQRIMTKLDHAADKIDHHDFRWGGPGWRHRERKRANKIPMGIAGTVGFGAALVLTGTWWLALPLTFFGLIPLTTGIAGLFKKKKTLPQDENSKKRIQEKEILQFALRTNGKITALQAASETSLSIEEAKQTLDEMVKNGHALLEVDENGLLVYEFPELSE